MILQQNELVVKEESGAVNASMSGKQAPRILGESQSVRRLTPLECERLQGFPTGWTMFGGTGRNTKRMKDTPRYRMLGNAVTAPVVEYIGRALAKALLAPSSPSGELR